MKNNEINDIRIISNSGNPNWAGGAFTIAFTYSNKGNFIVKGFYTEVSDYLNELKNKGYKFIVNKTLWSTNFNGEKDFRNIWDCSNNSVFIFEPNKCRSKWEVSGYKTLKFKRLPKKWIPEFEEII